MENKIFKNLNIEKFHPTKIKNNEYGYGDKDLNNFLLTLGLICNDFHDYWRFRYWLEEYESPKSGSLPNSHDGEFAGLIWHINRLIISGVHEVLIFIQNNQSIFQNENMIKILDKMPESSKNKIIDLVKLSCDYEKDIKTRKYKKLAIKTSKIRNGLTFHYNKTNLSERVQYGFPRTPKKPHEQMCYLASYPDSKDTRFYFIDKIIQGIFEDVSLSEEDIKKDIIPVWKKILETFYMILQIHHHNLGITKN